MSIVCIARITWWLTLAVAAFVGVIIAGPFLFYPIVTLPAGDDWVELILILVGGMGAMALSMAVLLFAWDKVLCLCDSRRSN